MRRPRSSFLKYQVVGKHENQQLLTQTTRTEAQKKPAPKVASQQKRDSLAETTERSEGRKIQNSSTAFTLQNVSEQQYHTRSASELTRPRKLKDYFLFTTNQRKKNDIDAFF